MAEPNQQDLAEFENNRAQLMNVSAQKQQLQLHSNGLGLAIAELEKSKEKKVYKAIGSVLILSDALAAKKELEDQKESAELRLKTLQKQEDSLLDKLNKLKSQIEKTISRQESQRNQEVGVE